MLKKMRNLQSGGPAGGSAKLVTLPGVPQR
jgi:hypothetical protein